MKPIKSSFFLIVISLMFSSLTSCSHQYAESNSHESVPTSSPEVHDNLSDVVKNDTVSVRTYVQQMYDDILHRYKTDDTASDYANKTYGSVGYNRLLSDLDAAIDNGEVEPLVYGWGCDPWIMAQDWVNNMKAEVVRTQMQPDHSCVVSVVIRNGNDGSIWSSPVLHLIEQGGVWKVDDFLPADADHESPTFMEALRKDFEMAKSAQ